MHNVTETDFQYPAQ